MTETSIYGFTLLRNGIKYDYPFMESLESLSPICKEVVVALGAGEDDTEKLVSGLGFTRTVPTIWDEKLREGGLILSQQTNIALSKLREKCQSDGHAWGIYLQCDEVLSEEDCKQIVSDIEYADKNGFDAVKFRYLHFWMDHNHIAINKKWYPQEIRAIRLCTDIESWGDAQSFRNAKKVFESDATVFHYGHVRDAEKYKRKKEDILKLYHSDERLPKYKRREKRYDDMTETLLYMGPHPKYMKKRIERMGDLWDFPQREKVYIVGDQNIYNGGLKNRINAKEIIWVKSIFDVPRAEWKKSVIANLGLIGKIFFPSHVPEKMRSKLARPWSKDFILLLKLSEKGVGIKRPIE